MRIFALAAAAVLLGEAVNAQSCRSAAAQQCKDRIFQVIQQHSQDFTGSDVQSICPNLRDNMACLLWQAANCETREQQQRSGEHILAAKNYLDRFCDVDGDTRVYHDYYNTTMIGWRNSRCYQYDEISRCENTFHQRRSGSDSCESYNRFKDCVKEVLQRRCSRSDEQSFPSFLIERARELTWTCGSISSGSSSSYDRAPPYDSNRHDQSRYDSNNRYGNDHARYDPSNPNNRYNNDRSVYNDRYNDRNNNNDRNHNDRYRPGYLPSHNSDDGTSSHRAPDNYPNNLATTSPRPYNPYDTENRYRDDRYYTNDRHNSSRTNADLNPLNGANSSYNNRDPYSRKETNDSYISQYNRDGRFNRFNDTTYDSFNRGSDRNDGNDRYKTYNDRYSNDRYGSDRYNNNDRYGGSNNNNHNNSNHNDDRYNTDRYSTRYNDSSNDAYSNNNNRFNTRYNDTNDPYNRHNSSYNRFDSRYNSTYDRYNMTNSYHNTRGFDSNNNNNNNRNNNTNNPYNPVSIYPDSHNETYSPSRYGGARGGYGTGGGTQDGSDYDRTPLGPHRITTSSTTVSPHRSPLSDSYCLHKAQDPMRECDSNHQRRQYNARRYHADERIRESCCATIEYKSCLRQSLTNHCRDYGYNTIDSIVQQKVRDADNDCRQFDSYRCANGARATVVSMIAVVFSVLLAASRLF